MYYHNGIQPYIFQLLIEMKFWISLSKEHPLFIKKMAQCQNVTIDGDLKNLLNQHFTDFKKLANDLQALHRQSESYLSTPMYAGHFLFEVSTTLHRICKADVAFLNSLKKLEKIPTKDPSWEVFINHIALEQRQLLQVCSSYSIQLKTMGY